MSYGQATFDAAVKVFTTITGRGVDVDGDGDGDDGDADCACNVLAHRSAHIRDRIQILPCMGISIKSESRARSPNIGNAWARNERKVEEC
jgi:hypothetical protein